MSSDPVIALPKGERRRLFEAAEAVVGIQPAMIEKDFWVCWTLVRLFGLPGAREHFIFKGGTSLSKVWRVIHRFSEDIDISLSREWLGFSGERDPERAATKNKRKNLLEALGTACADKLGEEVLPALRDSMRGILGPEGWSLEIDGEDPQTILYAYPGALDDSLAAGYIRPVVKIECGARSDRWPMEDGRVVPYVAEAFPGTLPDAFVDVPVLGAERTFWEKATILHAEAHRPEESATPARFSRHYSDLAALGAHAVCARALSQDDLRARVVAHKQAFFASGWAHYETAVPGSFRLIPPESRLATLERDYAAMREMFFKAPPKWDDVVGTLKALEDRINRKDT